MPGVPALRRLVSVVGNAVFRLVFWSSVRDLTTGYRAYRSTAVEGLELRSTGFEVQLELAVRLLAAGERIAEIPLQLGVREAGVSKMRYLSLVAPYARRGIWLFGLRWSQRLRARSASS